MKELRYDGEVVVITGAGNGIGKEYAKLFASRGAKVVVNDLGGSINGDKSEDSRVAAQVVREIEAAGGIAVPNYDSVEEGDKIIATAIEKFGRIDVLINNAGILRDVTLRKMSPKDWDLILAVHLEGAYKTVRAAWPYFVKQGYGRILNTTSSSGLFGNFGQSNYAAAKTALLGFTKTLAQEGAAYNIKANILAPGAASRLTATVWPPEMMELMSPVWIAPLIAVLCHSSCNETGEIFEAAVGHFSKIRRIRTPGVLLHPSQLTSPAIIAKHMESIQDLSGPQEEDIRPSEPTINMAGKVALVVGGGTRVGRIVCHQWARLGVKLAIQDVSLTTAQILTREIQDLGGQAIALAASAGENGSAIVNTVVQQYGRLDIIVNTSYIEQPQPFIDLTDAQWATGCRSRLQAAFEVISAAWPHMMKQKFGRIVNIISVGGVDGVPGQAHYSAGESGLIGFSKSIAREGAKYNIQVNTITSPAAAGLWETSKSAEEALFANPLYLAPLVTVLCSDQAPSLAGQLYEAGGGSFKLCRWQRALGYNFSMDEPVPTPEAVAQVLGQICDFNRSDFPDTPAEGSVLFMANAAASTKGQKLLGGAQRDNYLAKIKQTIGVEGKKSHYRYTERDVLLYNLSVGAKRTDLPLVFEGDPQFHVLPTFGIVPTYYSAPAYKLTELVPNFDPRMLLHGEQYLKILEYPIPTEAHLVSTSKLVEVVDKGNAALVRSALSTINAATGRPVFYGEGLAFIRGSGGFGGPRSPSDRGAATAANIPPARAPDAVVEEQTFAEQAAFYRLMGDRNPLHIDPKFSSVGGFKDPILHGLATFGITGRHIWSKYGPFRDIKVRFAGTVLPGQTIVTRMWKENKKVIFEAYVQETGKKCISNAAAELLQEGKALL